MRIFAKNKMAKHNELGKEGENASCRILNEQRIRIRHRQTGIPGERELDIVASKKTVN